MQQRLVAWGDIGTDHKALLAIEFDASEHKVKFHAFPEEKVDLELQHRLFTIWKNGGELEFPEGITSWETDAEFSHLLPENIKLHKPELLVQAQEQWNKIQEHENNFKLLGERMHLLELELDNLKSFNRDLWNKTKKLWEEISGQKRDGQLGWTHADELKIRINQVFDGLKAFRRLNKEKNFDESKALTTIFKKQIREQAEKLIYPDEWKNIFKNLQGIQKQMKDAPLLYKHRRGLMKQLNVVFNDLRKYRKSDQINHIEDRINGLERVFSGIEKSIDRDEQSYKNQFEKMKHYTRGKMSDAEIEAQLTYLKDQGKAKRKKLKSIAKTIRSLEKRLESLKNPPKKEDKAPEKKRKKGKKAPAGKKEAKSAQEEKPAVAKGDDAASDPPDEKTAAAADPVKQEGMKAASKVKAEPDKKPVDEKLKEAAPVDDSKPQPSDPQDSAAPRTGSGSGKKKSEKASKTAPKPDSETAADPESKASRAEDPKPEAAGGPKKDLKDEAAPATEPVEVEVPKAEDKANKQEVAKMKDEKPAAEPEEPEAEAPPVKEKSSGQAPEDAEKKHGAAAGDEADDGDTDGDQGVADKNDSTE